MNKDTLVSLCIVTYNQESYIKELLAGALSQDYENLEIIISDDNSTDNTYKIIEEICSMYSGKHLIILNKNEKNLGLVGNLNKALQLSKGEYIVLGAGDDRMYSNRVSTSVQEIIKLNVSSVTFNMRKIDSASNLLNDNILNSAEDSVFVYNIKNYFKREYISCGASRIIDRKLISVFGMIDESCPTEDSVFNIRAFLMDGLAFSSIVLGDYRVHNTSISSPINLLTKIDPYLIYQQYEKDLNLAFKLNYISKNIYRRFRRFFNSYLERETALREVYNTKGFCKRICVWMSYLPSFKMKLTYKVSLFFKIVFWNKGGE